MGQGRKGAALATGAVMFGIVMAGCSSGSSSKSADSGSGPTVGTAAKAASPASGAISVDLVVTGDRTATVKGTKGTCEIPTGSTLGSRYDLSAADYPALGADGFLSVTGPEPIGGRAAPANLKALIGGAGFLDTDGSGLTVAANRKRVTVDADLGGGTAMTPDNPGTPVRVHISGTITCS